MAINPETLQRLRGDMPQQELAETAGVNRRTISRIESGEIAPEKVRQHTIKCLAKALNVTPERLAKAPDEADQRDAKLRELGYRRVSFYFDGRTALSFELVRKRYGISVKGQIDMAPLFTVLLAETCLAERKRQLEHAKAAFEQSVAQLPKHLAFGASSNFYEAYQFETRSVAAKDVFGKTLSAIEFVEPFNPDETNPFFAFLEKRFEHLSEQSEGEEEDLADLRLPGHDGLPTVPAVLEGFLEKICAGNFWARRALEEGKVRLNDIPEDLWSPSRDADRGQWLESRYPAEERAKWDALGVDLDSAEKSDA
jgi:transcriptional regulator with XRE-family HTH domain